MVETGTRAGPTKKAPAHLSMADGGAAAEGTDDALSSGLRFVLRVTLRLAINESDDVRFRPFVVF